MKEITAIVRELQNNNLYGFASRINSVIKEITVAEANREAVIGMPMERNRLLRILPELWDRYKDKDFSVRLKERIKRLGLSYRRDSRWLLEELKKLTDEEWKIDQKDFAYSSDYSNDFSERLKERLVHGKLGTVYTAKARLYDKKKKEIGYCIDTPNAIAKAFMEWPEAMFVKPYMEDIQPKRLYEDRMKSWNDAESGLSKELRKKRDKR